MLKHKVKSFVCLIFLSFLVSCTSVDASDTTLTMAWTAGPPTKHVVFYELYVIGEFENADDNTTKIDNRTQFEASYTQTISDHPDGLLVRQDDFKVAEPIFDGSSITPSKKQIEVAKVTALLFASRPHYIMSPNGEFVRFHQFEQFNEIQNARLKGVFDAPVELEMQELTSLIESAQDEALLQAQITVELKLLRDLDQLSLTTDIPIEKTITPAYKTTNNKDDRVDGMLSYRGAHACNWKAPAGCVELGFNSNDKNVYDARIVVEPDSLFLHSYHAQTHVFIQNEQDDAKLSNTSSVQFSHTIERF